MIEKPNPPPKDAISMEEVSALLGPPRTVIYKLIASDPDFPTPFKLGKRLFWKRADRTSTPSAKTHHRHGGSRRKQPKPESSRRRGAMVRSQNRKKTSDPRKPNRERSSAAKEWR
jgi:predicted DNA-binding transcriptional regulator AlpA